MILPHCGLSQETVEHNYTINGLDFDSLWDNTKLSASMSGAWHLRLDALQIQLSMSYPAICLPGVCSRLTPTEELHYAAL